VWDGRVHVRHRLDLSFGDVLFGVLACVVEWGRYGLARRALRAFGVEADGLVCLSVRTGWDLYLRALGLDEGEEVLVSAVTHPDMVRIAREHRLRVVPVDLDPETLAPLTECLEASLTGRTRVVLVAHLFGGRVDLGPLARFAAENGLLLVEDCAQAFAGPEEVGCPETDVSMYSFGTLKTATALGGAILRVKDPKIRARMRELEVRYPGRRRHGYAGRLLKATVLMGVSAPRVYGLLLSICGRLGVDIEDLIRHSTSAFPASRPGDGLVRRIRRRPSAPQLAMLARRLERFDTRTLVARAEAGDRLSRDLDPSILQPGSDTVGRTYWVFPVVVWDPDGLVRGLRARGFDASRATSNIAALRSPQGGSRAERMMDGIVFLPAYPALEKNRLERLAVEVNRLAAPVERAWRLPA
jgi:perosamine synthetase